MKQEPKNKRKDRRAPAPIWNWTKTAAAKRMFKWCRWLHVYLSTALFSLLMFFCITGLFLNHTAWFSSNAGSSIERINLPKDLAAQLMQSQDPPLDMLKSYVQKQTGLTEPRKVDLDLELGEWTFDYPLPAGYAFVTIFIAEAVMEIEIQRGTLIAVMNDLHKGRHTGTTWSWVIDISAILLCLLSMTGLFILFQQAKWRVSGVLLVILGTLAPILIYFLWVPAYG